MILFLAARLSPPVLGVNWSLDQDTVTQKKEGR